MKRRRLFTALAIALLPVVFFAAKYAASWRPVALGRVHNAQPSYVRVAALSPRYLVARDGVPSDVLFDLQTHAQRPLQREGIATQGAWTWKIEPAEPAHLKLQQAGADAGRYFVPGAAPDFVGQPFHWVFHDVRVSPQLDRVELLLDERYYRWSLKSRQLERAFGYKISDGNDRAISRDGETIISVGYQAITHVSTRDGRVVRQLPFAGFDIFGWASISPFGSYAFYPTFSGAKGKGRRPEVLRLIDTGNGQTLWTLNGQTYEGFDAFFSADEKWIAMPINYLNQWHIRETATGKFVRALPFMPTSIKMRGAPRGAFSPDNSTIYSVADGVLYRQRAR